MSVREGIIKYCGKGIAKACTVGVRYSNIRSQFQHKKGVERTIIDYQQQKNKIYPLLAKSFALTFSAEKISEQIRVMLKKVDAGDFSLMKECHILLCGGK